MNKHIALVKRWLADPASVSQAELEANKAAAATAFAAYTYAADVVYDAYEAAYEAAYFAAAYDARRQRQRARYWVKKYEEVKRYEELADDE